MTAPLEHPTENPAGRLAGRAPQAPPRTVTARPPRRRLPRGVVADVAGLAVAAVLVFPVYWMVVTAFKPGVDILTYTPRFLPSAATLDNFRDALARPQFWSSVANSVVVTLSTVAISSVVALLAALAVARMRFPGRAAYIVMIMFVQMIPLTAMVIPLYLLLNSVGQTDRLSGVVATYLAFVLPFTVWTLRGFVAGVPADLEEAAMVDGCTRLQAFRLVVLPLVAPGLVATSVYAFIQAWNEYVLAYVMLSSPENQTVTVWLAAFTTQKGTEWGPLMAASCLTALPVVVFFLVLQGRMATGLTAGAVKG